MRWARKPRGLSTEVLDATRAGLQRAYVAPAAESREVAAAALFGTVDDIHAERPPRAGNIVA
jgi:hypothetical protein